MHELLEDFRPRRELQDIIAKERYGFYRNRSKFLKVSSFSCTFLNVKHLEICTKNIKCFLLNILYIIHYTRQSINNLKSTSKEIFYEIYTSKGYLKKLSFGYSSENVACCKTSAELFSSNCHKVNVKKRIRFNIEMTRYRS